MTEATSYFRYEEVHESLGYTDEWGDYVHTGSRVRLQLREFKVMKHTPCGVRIDDYSTGGRFISRDWNKQWASPTVEEARKSFIARKKRQIRILEAKLKRAYEAKDLADHNGQAVPKEVGWLIPMPTWARGSA